jgi:quinol monooxygenase YgiN/GNAT superfamily N-acetyltransferase
MALSFRFASKKDLPALLRLRLSVDADQARRYGTDRWTTTISERSVARGLKTSRVVVATQRGRIVGALRMETKKPWAIDLRHFTPVTKAVYLHDVNVDPQRQRSGVGRQIIEWAKTVARDWPVEAIRLDAYDGASGGGPFYRKCGFTKVGRAIYRGVPLVYFEFLVNRPRTKAASRKSKGMEDTRRQFLAAAGALIAAAGVGVAAIQRGGGEMYGLISKITAQAGQRESLARILIDGTDGMPGCLSYVVAADVADPDALWVTEVWESQASHQASLQLPAVQAAIARGRPIIAGFSNRVETAPLGGQGIPAPAKTR